MMTKRHRKYLKNYAARIGRERRLRKIVAKRHQLEGNQSIKKMRETLRAYMNTKATIEPIKKEPTNILSKVKRTFRKPTV